MNHFYQEDGITILQGDCRQILPTLPDQSVNCCVTADKRLRQAFLPLAETPDKISQECRRETKDLFEENPVA